MRSVCAIATVGLFIVSVSHIIAAPADPTSPGLNLQRNPDGSISGSFGFSQAINSPGANGAFGASQTFNFGPNGSSFSQSQSAALNSGSPGGNNNFGFSQSNSLSQNQGPNGFGSSGANSASSQFSNPLFSTSQAQANAFANQVQLNNNNDFNKNNNYPFSSPNVSPDFPRRPFMRRPGFAFGQRGQGRA